MPVDTLSDAFQNAGEVCFCCLFSTEIQGVVERELSTAEVSAEMCSGTGRGRKQDGRGDLIEFLNGALTAKAARFAGASPKCSSAILNDLECSDFDEKSHFLYAGTVAGTAQHFGRKGGPKSFCSQS